MNFLIANPDKCITTFAAIFLCFACVLRFLDWYYIANWETKEVIHLAYKSLFLLFQEVFFQFTDK